MRIGIHRFSLKSVSLVIKVNSMMEEMTEISYSRTRSGELYEEAKQYFPGGVDSPVRAFKSVIGPPVFMKKGDGARVWDEDDNEYIDFCCSWGPLIHGHNPRSVAEAIHRTVDLGTSFGTPTIYGLELGKLLNANIPFLEKLRFVSSGTEAVMSAIRLARGYTSRSKILKFDGCYHGHVDSLLVNAGSGLVTFGVSSSAGIPESFAAETLVVPLDDETALKAAFDVYGHEIAAVIIEPVPANNGLLLQRPEFLTYLRKICTDFGVLLIFDEVISGFRIGFTGAAGHYGIEPDLVTYGKIIGGGMPVGAYGGRREIMGQVSPDGPVYQAGTLSGNPVAMAAGKAALSMCLNPEFYVNLEKLTADFCKDINAFADEYGYDFSMPHIGSIFWPCFSKQTIRNASQIDASSMELFKKFHFFLLQRGIYFGPSGYEVGFVSAAHDASILEEASEKIKMALDHIYQNEEL